MESDYLNRFERALTLNMRTYNLELSTQVVSRLVEYFRLLSHWNARLHLVAPCEPEEFATRHILESLLLLHYLPNGSGLADVGSGAGLPVIPCLLARPDLSATLIESSQKKSVFLRESLNQLGISQIAKIIAQPFEEVLAPEVAFVTCRALDQFLTKVSRLLKWSPKSSELLLFGGDKLREQLIENGAEVEAFLIPNSAQRFLFRVRKTTKA
jgi:16S rRNA (guanine(527)-N(7))-methyltransferase RsmG